MGSFLVHRLDSKNILIGPGGFAAGQGDGSVYRTSDQGATWTGIALPVYKTESITQVNRLVDDRNDTTGNTVFAATSHGIFRSPDFGLTWKRVFVGVASGDMDEVSDIVQDTGNPAIWYAAADIDHAIIRSTQWGLLNTWAAYPGTAKITGSVGRVSLAVTDADPNVIYALVIKAESASTNPKGFKALYRSLDRGGNWTVIFDDHDAVDRLNQGRHTAGLGADPSDPGEVQDIVINTHNVGQITLYIGTRGRGFWQRLLE